MARSITWGATRVARCALNQLFTDALDLALQAKQAHWNVKGPSFITCGWLYAGHEATT